RDLRLDLPRRREEALPQPGEEGLPRPVAPGGDGGARGDRDGGGHGHGRRGDARGLQGRRGRGRRGRHRRALEKSGAADADRSDQRVKVTIGLNAVIVAVTHEVPRILTVMRRTESGLEEALPFGPLEPETDRTLDRGLRRWVREQTGLEVGYVEQLYTFGDRNR